MNELVTKDNTLPVPAGIDGMIEQAIAANLDIDKLERLLALKERHEAGEARRAYHAALARFQRECPTIIKHKEVKQRTGALMYKYAPLGDIITQVKELEADCGFSHSFDQISRDDGSIEITCSLTHLDGHVGTSTATIPPTRGVNTNSAQDMSIMRTYGMRSAYLGVLGITVADEDMDGRLPQSVDPITVEQSWQLDALITETGADRDAFLRWAGVSELEELPASKMKQALTLLHKKAAKS